MSYRYRIIYKGTSIEAPPGEFLLGRSVDCHLVLDDPSVSRIHAAIIRGEDTLTVVDKGSRNGVLVNEKHIDGAQDLHDGDHIAIGHQTIRIVALARNRDADRTLGLTSCPSCGAWMPVGAIACPSCNAATSSGAKSTRQIEGTGPKDQQQSVIERQPLTMLSGLALKATRVNKLDDARRLLENAISIVSDRVASGPPLQNDEFDAIIEALFELAVAAKEPAHIANIFALHAATRRLISRDMVEKLYRSARDTGYRTDPMLSQYLEFLDSRIDNLSPGEKFVHRRLQGLVKVFS
jgi:hypothetical protein